MFAPRVPLSPVSYRNASVRTLHLGACPRLTRIPHHYRRSLCCSAQTSRELNFKLLTASALTIFTTLHVSMMYLATPATLITTQNPRFFIRDVCCNIALGPSVALLRSTHRSLTARNIRNQASERRREGCGHRCTPCTCHLITLIIVSQRLRFYPQLGIILVVSEFPMENHGGILAC